MKDGETMGKMILMGLLILVFSGCRAKEHSNFVAVDQPIDEGAYCVVYSPEGQTVFDAQWNGSMPKVEAYEGSYSTATFGMGCFWGPAAEFAVLDGVLRTRVGYTGGQLTTPSYDNLGNHIEVFEVDYDPEKISYEDLVNYYFSAYDATERPFSRRVHSVIYYRNENEKTIAQGVKGSLEKTLGRGVFTEVDAMEDFYLAEAEEQLLYLKVETSIYHELTQIFPDYEQQLLSILASKLNGHIAGYGTEDSLEELLKASSLSEASQLRMRQIQMNQR